MAKKSCSESTCRVYCDECIEWRFAGGFAAHRCCTESSCKDVDRIMSFASSQITANAEAWAVYGKTNRIADFVLGDPSRTAQRDPCAKAPARTAQGDPAGQADQEVLRSQRLQPNSSRRSQANLYTQFCDRHLCIALMFHMKKS